MRVCDACGSVALEQGRYTWRHNNCLTVIANEIRRAMTAAKQKPVVSRWKQRFVKSGESVKKEAARSREPQKPHGYLDQAHDWQLYADLPDFPCDPLGELCGEALTAKRPDIVLRSASLKKVLLIELTVPSEHLVTAAHERKLTKYKPLLDDLEVDGFTAELMPFEVSVIGFLAPSCSMMLRSLGIWSSELRNKISDTVLRSSYWLFLSRFDEHWTPWPLRA